ncbi:putative tetratricopeptide repeat protein 31-like isoform X2 [Penaeus vannamei]|uniref:Putative tetratricopeptide repeat protein 31-like isoform X2 n=1 Tax=Penaeus vannamei TaxID=6689 RepID=A0A423TI41_PENVA|nr:putative tetratricopeptide repeat protein 31-like isoform X2 [Penaeus vannamei]
MRRLSSRQVDQQTPWVAAGIGLILGVLVVVGDAVLADEPMLTHPVLQSIITIVFSVLGLMLGYCYRWYIKNQRKALLEPPIDLLGENESKEGAADGEEKASEENAQEETRSHTRPYPTFALHSSLLLPPPFLTFLSCFLSLPFFPLSTLPSSHSSSAIFLPCFLPPSLPLLLPPPPPFPNFPFPYFLPSLFSYWLLSFLPLPHFPSLLLSLFSYDLLPFLQVFFPFSLPSSLLPSFFSPSFPLLILPPRLPPTTPFPNPLPFFHPSPPPFFPPHLLP